QDDRDFYPQWHRVPGRSTGRAANFLRRILHARAIATVAYLIAAKRDPPDACIGDLRQLVTIRRRATTVGSATDNGVSLGPTDGKWKLPCGLPA
ncbi:MAG: hypothetical protein ACRD2L_22480, partial [Terriglobia bacterium]